MSELKHLWAINRAYHADAAELLLNKFNELNCELQQLKSISTPDFNPKKRVLELIDGMEKELAQLQDLTVYHSAESAKYSAMIAGTYERKLFA